MDRMGTRAGEAQLLPPATLPTYTGYDEPKSVADFLEEIDRYVRATGASEAHVMARIRPLALRAAAGRWWRLQTPFTTRAEFEQRFREEFLPPGYELRVQRELELRTQHPDESLLEYVRTMQELHRRAAPTASERDQVARVIRQSHPRFRPFLYGRTFETLEHLAREARGVQDALLAESTYVPPPAPQSALEPSLAWRAPVASPSCDLTSPGAFTAISSRALDPFAHEGLTLDFPARGYRLHGQSETTPFAEKKDFVPVSRHAEGVAATHTTLPQTPAITDLAQYFYRNAQVI
ncbi:uncharacterized protein LOC125758311 [Rhipicephalus sanguineus]|uniref:uncharacterized protein LOC125758311 n=1 Tax=Rhipicephalus sanguineus TaxID=34632 RepID=UPI0020C59D95|nr:uncharacterized protein LOC125758311 [Rhipicephalus sanguineus]